MSKPFKQLRGRTILLDVPKRKESAIQLSAKDEDIIMQEAMKMWSKLTVYAVGDRVIYEGKIATVIKLEGPLFIRISSTWGTKKVPKDKIKPETTTGQTTQSSSIKIKPSTDLKIKDKNINPLNSNLNLSTDTKNTNSGFSNLNTNNILANKLKDLIKKILVPR